MRKVHSRSVKTSIESGGWFSPGGGYKKAIGYSNTWPISKGESSASSWPNGGRNNT